MKKTAQWLKRQPIEVYIFVLIPFIEWGVFALLNPGFFSRITPAFLRGMAFYLFFGGQFFVNAVAAIYLYFIAKLYVFLGRRFIKLAPGSRHAPLRSLWAIAGSGLYLIVLIGLAAFSNIVVVQELSFAAPERVRAASELLMALDYRIFGSYPPFSLQWLAAFPLFERLIIGIYENLGLVLSITLLLLLVANRTLFRKFLLSFVFSVTLSVPLWYAWPGISPDEMYRQNILSVPVPPAVAREIAPALALSPAMQEFVRSLEGHWSNVAQNEFAVTSFPSMHAAWGILIAYFAILLWRPLAFVFAPWAALNLLSTVSTLQHYAVDAVAGLLIACLGIWLAELLVNWEERRRPSVRGAHFAILELIAEDVRGTLSFLMTSAADIWNYFRRLPWKAR